MRNIVDVDIFFGKFKAVMLDDKPDSFGNVRVLRLDNDEVVLVGVGNCAGVNDEQAD